MSEPIVWRRFEDEEPERDKKYLAGDKYGVAQEGSWEYRGEWNSNFPYWYPAPQLPAPKPKPGQVCKPGQVWRDKRNDSEVFIIKTNDGILAMKSNGYGHREIPNDQSHWELLYPL